MQHMHGWVSDVACPALELRVFERICMVEPNAAPPILIIGGRLSARSDEESCTCSFGNNDDCGRVNLRGEHDDDEARELDDAREADSVRTRLYCAWSICSKKPGRRVWRLFGVPTLAVLVEKAGLDRKTEREEAIRFISPGGLRDPCTGDKSSGCPTAFVFPLSRILPLSASGEGSSDSCGSSGDLLARSAPACHNNHSIILAV